MLEEEKFVVALPPGRVPPIHRVLVAFDGSPSAWAALRYAIAVATTRNAILTIAAVVNDPPFWVALPPFAVPWTRESLRRADERRLARALADARDDVPASISVSTALLHGRTAHALADLADGGRYDLVVTGRKHTGRRPRRLLRGVTLALVTRCQTSVLAVESRETR
jgi:nucleotide-binding universal stress UspA family protein